MQHAMCLFCISENMVKKVTLLRTFFHKLEISGADEGCYSSQQIGYVVILIFMQKKCIIMLILWFSF